VSFFTNSLWWLVDDATTANGLLNGIYLILDNTTGLQYIGSAYGSDGIWGRWKEYARTKDGGNKKLVEMVAVNPNCVENFTYSILQTLPSNLNKDEVIRYENLYKEKLGSRAHGLNLN
jgi:hypothetical protein